MSEIGPEIIARTQKSLGKYVKKPALTEKLLKKPPFRFLHDVIKAVIRETGFLNGLFSDSELNSENVKEKEAKIAFLTKLIEAVRTLSKTDLKVRPSKVVAGLEPIETNILLQTIAKCVDKKVDSKEYTAKLKTGEAKEKSKNSANKTNKKNAKDTSKPVRDSSSTRSKKAQETPKSSDRKESLKRKSDKVKENPNNNKERPPRQAASNPEKEPVEVEENRPQEQENAKDNDETTSDPEKVPDRAAVTPLAKQTDEETIPTNPRQSSAGLIRPKSARPKSGDRSKEIHTSAEPPIEMKAPPIANRPSSSLLRPPSVRPSSARPGAPRLRPESATVSVKSAVMGNINVIVENFDGGGDEENTVVIQNAPEVLEEDPLLESDLLNENKGQLVEQILEQIQESQEEEGLPVRKRVDIDWEQDGLRGKDATTKEVNQLRALIQSLTKTANPLGKLLNYLHEDLEAMHNELQMWTNTKKQLYLEIDKQKKLAIESSKPSLDKLDRLKQEIKKQEQEIVAVRSNILRNDQRISELLGTKSSAF